MKEDKQFLQKVKKETNLEAEIWAAASIAKVFDKLKLPYDRTQTRAPSFTKTFLSPHPNEPTTAIPHASELHKTHTTLLDPT